MSYDDWLTSPPEDPDGYCPECGEKIETAWDDSLYCSNEECDWTFSEDEDCDREYDYAKENRDEEREWGGLE